MLRYFDKFNFFLVLGFTLLLFVLGITVASKTNSGDTFAFGMVSGVGFGFVILMLLRASVLRDRFERASDFQNIRKELEGLRDINERAGENPLAAQEIHQAFCNLDMLEGRSVELLSGLEGISFSNKLLDLAFFECDKRALELQIKQIKAKIASHVGACSMAVCSTAKTIMKDVPEESTIREFLQGKVEELESLARCTKLEQFCIVEDVARTQALTNLLDDNLQIARFCMDADSEQNIKQLKGRISEIEEEAKALLRRARRTPKIKEHQDVLLLMEFVNSTLPVILSGGRTSNVLMRTIKDFEQRCAAVRELLPEKKSKK